MKMECRKLCNAEQRCEHVGPHDKVESCDHTCENGATCQPVKKQRSNSTIVSHDSTTTLTAERGKHYGHPRDHFACTRGMFLVWEQRRNQAIEESKQMEPHEEAMRHAVYMICDKLARMATNPMHGDNLADIQGYARCAKMVLGLEK